MAQRAIQGSTYECQRDTWLQPRKTERYVAEKRYWRRIEAGRDSLAFCTPQSEIRKILPSMGRTVHHHWENVRSQLQNFKGCESNEMADRRLQPIKASQR